MFESDLPNHDEYSYAKKREGKLKVLSRLLICLYVVFVLAFFLVCYLTRVIPLFAVAPLLLWILIFFTWRLVSFDVGYTFERGTLSFRHLSGKSHKASPVLLTVQVKETEYIGAADTVRAKEAVESASRVYDFASSSASPARVLAAFKGENGERLVVCFDTTAKLIRLLPHFAPTCDFTGVKAK